MSVCCLAHVGWVRRRFHQDIASLDWFNTILDQVNLQHDTFIDDEEEATITLPLDVPCVVEGGRVDVKVEVKDGDIKGEVKEEEMTDQESQKVPGTPGDYSPGGACYTGDRNCLIPPPKRHPGNFFL